MQWRLEVRDFRTHGLSFDFDLDFEAAPLGGASDRIEETICYGDLCEDIRAVCAQDISDSLMARVTRRLQTKVGDRARVTVRAHALPTRQSA